MWRPYTITKNPELRSSGSKGSTDPYKLLKGCTEEVKRKKQEADGLVLDVQDHNYLPRIAPHYLKWRTEYGEPFLYWFGAKPRICIFDCEMARQVFSSKSGHFVKNDKDPTVSALLGSKGLVQVEGKDWVHHRRVINPAFAMDKLKMMTKTMVSCAQNMFKKLEEQASSNKNGETQIEIDKPFQELTADIISRTAFGSSYKLGLEAFHAQRELQKIAMESVLDVQIPGFNYLPTERNRQKWMLENKLKSTHMQIIKSRLVSERSGYGNEIIDECRTFFFAGHETTSLLLTWTVFLLSLYPAEWQDRLRKEVLREFGKESPSGDNLSKLKEMTMVLLETLRLYGPALFLQRKPIEDIALGDIKIPKGHTIIIPLPIMHRDNNVWGEDADQFNPLRFENGVTKAGKVPHALLAFSIGPRACIGQNFAMLEANSVMAMILQKFSFTLSPSYVHAPAEYITLHPKFGLPVILKVLDA